MINLRIIMLLRYSLVLLLLSTHFVSADTSAISVDSGVSNAQQDGKKSIVLIVGASYAEHWQIGEIDGHIVVNKGVSGSETGPMLERFTADINATKPDVVLIWGFINDIFRSEPEKLDQKLVKTKKNIETIVNICREKGITPIVATEVTITSKDTWQEKIMSIIGGMIGKEGYSDYINKHVMDTNIWLRQYAAENNVMVLDFEKVLANDKGERKREYAVEDGSHLTKQAYEVLTKYMENINI